jgi:hypothetical protein
MEIKSLIVKYVYKVFISISIFVTEDSLSGRNEPLRYRAYNLSLRAVLERFPTPASIRLQAPAAPRAYSTAVHQ